MIFKLVLFHQGKLILGESECIDGIYTEGKRDWYLYFWMKGIDSY